MNLEQFKAIAKQEFVDQYNLLGLRASGRFEKELEAIHKITQTRITITIQGARHARYMEEGIKPYKHRDDKTKLRRFALWAGSTFLKEWVKNKGIDRNPYAVAYKIARKGVRVPNPYNKGGAISKPIREINGTHLQRLIEGQYNLAIKTVKSEIKSLAI